MSILGKETFGHLLEEISFRRRRDLTGEADGFSEGKTRLDDGQSGYSANRNTTYWTDLFVRHFLFQSDYQSDGDDLLFFIRKNFPGHHPDAHRPFVVEVFRKDSRKLPIGDPDIDWEETIYLNLIIHQLNYTLTLAVCTRTSPKNLQVLKRYSQKVYATPSRRKMESKGDSEEMTYPYVSFSLDNFDDAFSEVVVRDGESLGIELTAKDHAETFDIVLFSACVHYETIRRVHEARASQTVRKRLSQTNLSNLFGFGNHHQNGKNGLNYSRVEYVRLVAIQGHAELAVSKVKDVFSSSYYYYSGSGNKGAETPASEPGESIFDQLCDSDFENDDENVTNNFVVGFKKGHQRRSSDPSSALNDFMRLGSGLTSNKKSSESTENLMDGFGDAHCEVYAGDLLDHLEDSRFNPLWTMKGYTQIFHSWRESKRNQCIPLGSCITYVTLPWWSIIKDVLDKKETPLLTF